MPRNIFDNIKHLTNGKETIVSIYPNLDNIPGINKEEWYDFASTTLHYRTYGTELILCASLIYGCRYGKLQTYIQSF